MQAQHVPQRSPAYPYVAVDIQRSAPSFVHDMITITLKLKQDGAKPPLDACHQLVVWVIEELHTRMNERQPV